MHQNQTVNTGRGNIPRLAMINDIAGFGRCSTAVSLPVISVLGVQVCPVPTSILSNHFGFPFCHFDDYTPHMRDYIHVWKQLGISFDGLYCGFFNSEEQLSIVEEFLNLFQPGLFLLDPVMGDHGKTYSTITDIHCQGLKKLAAKADILTPNLTEACLLTDTAYHEAWTEEELDNLMEKLITLCPKSQIVVTGILQGEAFLNLIFCNKKKTTCITPRAGASRPGTGDLFASILIADALQGKDFCTSVKHASDFVALCIETSEKAGSPIQEGVLFESCLRELIL